MLPPKKSATGRADPIVSIYALAISTSVTVLGVTGSILKFSILS